jgi:uncharacterized protein with PQ loop repeat
MIHGLSSFVFFFVFFFVIPFQALWRAAHARHFCVVKCGANWQTQTISPQTRRQVQKVYTHTHTQSVSLSLSLVSSLSHLIFFLYGRRRRDFQGEEKDVVPRCTMLKTLDNRLVAMQCFPFHAFPMWRKSFSAAGREGGPSVIFFFGKERSN